MDETKVLYLAGDTSSAPEWMEADAEHRFYSENGAWEKIEAVPAAHSITYKGAGAGGHDHSDFFVSKPSEAKAGDTVDVTFYPQSLDINPTFGITDASVQSISETSQLEQQRSFGATGMTMSYSFTMPNHDVTVWVWCPGTYLHKVVVV